MTYLILFYFILFKLVIFGRDVTDSTLIQAYFMQTQKSP